jgi:hypothetical protein
MNRKSILYIGLPVTLLILYVLGTFLIPFPGPKTKKIVFSEQGIVEVGTALFYFAAAVVGFLLCLKTKTAPKKWRAFYLLVGLMALFVALEETNYGQYFFEFDTPDEIAQHNSKDEFNLHNMLGNLPARRLNLITTLGFPTFFLFLPLVACRDPHNYTPQRWVYYVLPEKQLFIYPFLAQLMSWYDDIFDFFGIANPWTRATEFKELYWAMAVLFWLLILYRRVLTKAQVQSTCDRRSRSLEHAMAE